METDCEFVLLGPGDVVINITNNNLEGLPDLNTYLCNEDRDSGSFRDMEEVGRESFKIPTIRIPTIIIPTRRDFNWVRRDFNWVRRDFNWVSRDFNWVGRDFNWVRRDFNWVRLLTL